MEITRKVAASGVTVVPYRDEFREAFEQLNRDWIEAYFVLEDPDREVFSDPRNKILAPGGQIFFVLEEGQVQGTCAVIRHTKDEYEIAKMAVASTARGRGFGDLLMQAAIAFATSARARVLIIVSNTVLEPAIRLYQKHGFVRVPLTPDERYQRANIRLERVIPPMASVERPGAAG